MYGYNTIGQRFLIPERQLEPNDPEAACTCSRCGQDVYYGEDTFDGLCPECFDDMIEEMIKKDRIGLAEELGYKVVRHE